MTRLEELKRECEKYFAGYDYKFMDYCNSPADEFMPIRHVEVKLKKLKICYQVGFDKSDGSFMAYAPKIGAYNHVLIYPAIQLDSSDNIETDYAYALKLEQIVLKQMKLMEKEGKQ